MFSFFTKSKVEAINVNDLDDKLKTMGESRLKVGVAQSFSTANSCVSRRVVNLLVGNDVNFDGGYGEDSDFGLSLSKIGVVVLHNPFAVNLHLKPPIGGYRFWASQSQVTGKKRKVQPWELDSPEGPTKTTWLIGRVCKVSNDFSLPVLIAREA